MKNSIFKSAFYFGLPCALAFAMAFTACAPGFQTPETQTTEFKHEAAKKVSAADIDRSDSLTDEAEAMVDPKTFNEAYGKFSEALQLNPENARAIFWKHFLKTALEMKGILTRVRPLYLSLEGGPDLYARLLSRASRDNQGTYSAFLKDGPEDIKTAAELQEWLDRLSGSVRDFRSALKQIRTREISITLPAGFNPDFIQWSKPYSCKETSFGPIRYSGINPAACSDDGPSQIGLNRADFEALITYTAGYQLYLDVLTAYRINPQVLLDPAKPSLESRAEAQNFVKALLSVDKGGELRKTSPFVGFKEVSSDLFASYQYLYSNQRDVCARGNFSPENRKGYLFTFGYCIFDRAYDEAGNPKEPENMRTLRSLELALMGPSSPSFDVGSGTDMKIRASKFVSAPPGNLKSLAPLGFDCRGRVTKINAETLAPYFESGDFLKYLASRTLSNPCSQGVDQ